MAFSSGTENSMENVNVAELEDSGADGNMEWSFDSTKNLVSRGIHLTKYILQKENWPKEGRHILAQYDSKSVIVYQAFKPEIAKYAVQHQKFGGPEFSYSRMSWIKTNFLWMMYRCGWASKKNQERVLAVRISQEGFLTILSKAYTAKFQREENVQTHEIDVRLQWDPDHSPTYANQARKAIQLGLKGDTLKTYGENWIQSITDITDFVKAQKKILDREGEKELMMPTERVYHVTDDNICNRIGLDVFQSGISNGDDMNNSTKNKTSLPPNPGEGPGLLLHDKWMCSSEDCNNLNIQGRKRCSRCNKPKPDLNVTESSPVGSILSQEHRTGSDTFTVPENLHIPPGMAVPDTEEEHKLIEKTAKYVAENGIQMEKLIKEKQGSNPKLSFLTLHHPLNFYYNHMVKMIKDGKYTS